MIQTLLLAAVLAYPPPGYLLTEHHESPKHTFTVETYVNPADQSEQGELVWLVPKDSKAGEAHLLFGPPQSVALEPISSVYVSPDEHWILIDQKLYHGANAVWLYKRVAPLQYAEVGPPHFSEQSWEFLRQQTHYTFDLSVHFITRFYGWGAHPASIVVSLYGDDENTYVREWFCRYDLDKQQFFLTPALKRKNKGRVSDSPPRR